MLTYNYSRIKDCGDARIKDKVIVRCLSLKKESEKEERKTGKEKERGEERERKK